MDTTENKEWYTAEEAARKLNIPMHRLSRLRRQGRITGMVGGGDNPRYSMYHISEIEKVDIRDLRLKSKEANRLRDKALVDELTQSKIEGGSSSQSMRSTESMRFRYDNLDHYWLPYLGGDDEEIPDEEKPDIKPGGLLPALAGC